MVKATEGVPTRSGVIGMILGAFGVPRGHGLDWLEDLTIAARVDKPGSVVIDFHTVGAPTDEVAVARTRHRLIASLGTDEREANFTVPSGAGSRWSVKGATTILTERAFLSDAEFILALSHPDVGRLGEISEALANPVFMTYLGRKAFAPAFPFHLGIHDDEPMNVLANLATGTSRGQPLAVHLIRQDKNYPDTYVTPPAASGRTELWNGWKAA